MAEQPIKTRKVPVSGFSPAPGCIIGLIGLVLVVLVGIWAIYTFVTQARQLDAFTDPEPAGLVVPEVGEAERTAVREKVRHFASEMEAGREATLRLDAAELNAMLAAYESLQEMRPLMTVREIGPESLTVQASLPLNTLPGRRAYLNGLLLLQPGVHEKGGLFLRTLDVQVPGRTVPPGFIQVYQEGVIPGKSFGFFDEMLLQNFRKDPEIGPFLKKISDAVLRDNELILTARERAMEG